MIRTQIQLTEALAMQAKQIAAKDHISISEFIRRAVAAFITASSKTNTEDKYERAATVAGKFCSAQTDMSKNHDTIFVEAVSS